MASMATPTSSDGRGEAPDVLHASQDSSIATESAGEHENASASGQSQRSLLRDSLRASPAQPTPMTGAKQALQSPLDFPALQAAQTSKQQNNIPSGPSSAAQRISIPTSHPANDGTDQPNRCHVPEPGPTRTLLPSRTCQQQTTFSMPSTAGRAKPLRHGADADAESDYDEEGGEEEDEGGTQQPSIQCRPVFSLFRGARPAAGHLAQAASEPAHSIPGDPHKNGSAAHQLNAGGAGPGPPGAAGGFAKSALQPSSAAAPYGTAARPGTGVPGSTAVGLKAPAPGSSWAAVGAVGAARKDAGRAGAGLHAALLARGSSGGGGTENVQQGAREGSAWGEVDRPGLGSAPGAAAAWGVAHAERVAALPATAAPAGADGARAGAVTPGMAPPPHVHVQGQTKAAGALPGSGKRQVQDAQTPHGLVAAADQHRHDDGDSDEEDDDDDFVGGGSGGRGAMAPPPMVLFPRRQGPAAAAPWTASPAAAQRPGAPQPSPQPNAGNGGCGAPGSAPAVLPAGDAAGRPPGPGSAGRLSMASRARRGQHTPQQARGAAAAPVAAAGPTGARPAPVDAQVPGMEQERDLGQGGDSVHNSGGQQQRRQQEGERRMVAADEPQPQREPCGEAGACAGPGDGPGPGTGSGPGGGTGRSSGRAPVSDEALIAAIRAGRNRRRRSAPALASLYEQAAAGGGGGAAGQRGGEGATAGADGEAQVGHALQSHESKPDNAKLSPSAFTHCDVLVISERRSPSSLLHYSPSAILHSCTLSCASKSLSCHSLCRQYARVPDASVLTVSHAQAPQAMVWHPLFAVEDEEQEHSQQHQPPYQQPPAAPQQPNQDDGVGVGEVEQEQQEVPVQRRRLRQKWQPPRRTAPAAAHAGVKPEQAAGHAHAGAAAGAVAVGFVGGVSGSGACALSTRRQAQDDLWEDEQLPQQGLQEDTDGGWHQDRNIRTHDRWGGQCGPDDVEQDDQDQGALLQRRQWDSSGGPLRQGPGQYTQPVQHAEHGGRMQPALLPPAAPRQPARQQHVQQQQLQLSQGQGQGLGTQGAKPSRKQQASQQQQAAAAGTRSILSFMQQKSKQQQQQQQQQEPPPAPASVASNPAGGLARGTGSALGAGASGTAARPAPHQGNAADAGARPPVSINLTHSDGEEPVGCGGRGGGIAAAGRAGGNAGVHVVSLLDDDGGEEEAPGGAAARGLGAGVRGMVVGGARVGRGLVGGRVDAGARGSSWGGEGAQEDLEDGGVDAVAADRGGVGSGRKRRHRAVVESDGEDEKEEEVRGYGGRGAKEGAAPETLARGPHMQQQQPHAALGQVGLGRPANGGCGGPDGKRRASAPAAQVAPLWEHGAGGRAQTGGTEGGATGSRQGAASVGPARAGARAVAGAGQAGGLGGGQRRGSWACGDQASGYGVHGYGVQHGAEEEEEDEIEEPSQDDRGTRPAVHTPYGAAGAGVGLRGMHGSDADVRDVGAAGMHPLARGHGPSSHTGCTNPGLALGRPQRVAQQQQQPPLHLTPEPQGAGQRGGQNHQQLAQQQQPLSAPQTARGGGNGVGGDGGQQLQLHQLLATPPLPAGDQAPWWTLLPDFVPAAAVAHGYDPRCGSTEQSARSALTTCSMPSHRAIHITPGAMSSWTVVPLSHGQVRATTERPFIRQYKPNRCLRNVHV